MKKIKLLTALSSLSLLGMISAPLTSCGNNQTIKVIGNKIQYADSECKATFKFSLPSTPKSDVKLSIKSNANIKLESETVKSFNNEITAIVILYNITESGEIKFTLNISYTDSADNTISQDITDLEVQYSSIKITSITLEGKNYVWTNKNYQYQAKVFPENASNKDVEWSIEKPAGSTAEASVDSSGNVCFTQHGQINLIATAKDGSGVKQSFNIIGFNESDAPDVSRYCFCTDEWSEIIQYANQGYDALLNHYYGLKGITDPFIGLERKININGVDHIVRVIGEKHDDLADGSGKAPLTFELVTLLSSNKNKPYGSTWNTNSHTTIVSTNYDYINSSLRKNLTGEGDGEYDWYEMDSTIHETFQFPVLSWLPNELQANIKTVKKSVAISNDSGSTYEVANYDDKLFSLTYTEMALSGWYVKEEGEPYKYWENHTSSSDRIKYVSSSRYSYWLTTPSIYEGDKDACLVIDIEGEFARGLTSNRYAINFAFCI